MIKIWPTKPISDEWILPDTMPPDDAEIPSYHIRACRGQYVPLSFCLRASEACRVSIDSTNFTTNYGKQFPGTDIRWVKVWRQNREIDYGKINMGLVPELLLHDSKATDSGLREDAETLQPLRLPANTTQQVRLTIRVPETAKSGTFMSMVWITIRSWWFERRIQIPVTITVMPFALAPSPIRYSVYYRGQVRPGEPAVSSESKTPDQYRAELQNMLAHGITHPTLYQGYSSRNLDAALEIRKLVGLPTDSLYWTSLGLAWYTPDNASLAEMKTTVNAAMAKARAAGYRDVFAYGKDEVKGEALVSQLAVWKAAQTQGVHVHASCYKDAPTLADGVLDLALHNDPEFDLSAWKKTEAWLYGPTSPEKPESWYRRRYGLAALRHGYKGCMPYAYQHIMGESATDDADHAYKDHMLAYPTLGKPIDTIQFEGLREAVTDVRYAATLAALGGVVPDERGRDLDELRDEMTDAILEWMK